MSAPAEQAAIAQTRANPIEILQALIRCPSVTPEEGGALHYLSALLGDAGFTTDIARFPRRPRIRVRFFRPADGARTDGEGPADLSVRLLEEIRSHAPIVSAKRG